MNKMVCNSEEDEFILPDIKSQRLKSELEEEVVMSPSSEHILGDSPCGGKFPSVPIKTEPLDLDSSQVTADQGLEIIESEMDLDDHWPPNPQDFLHIQLVTSIHQEDGLKDKLPALPEQAIVDPEQGLVLGEKCSATQPKKTITLQKSDVHLKHCLDVQNNNSSVNSSNVVHSCKHCKMIFESLDDLKEHDPNHETDQMFNRCCQCRETFTDNNMFKNHMEMHVIENPNECVQDAEYDDLLNENLNNSSQSVDKPHRCNQCGKSFRQKSHLTTHHLSHTTEKPHICSLCEKAFQQKSHLYTHMLSHSSEKPHKCSQCGKSFRQKSHLYSHSLSHSTEKPHKCGQCGKEFSRNGDLTRHLFSHATEKPHKCGICGKAFIQESQLNLHISTHSADRPFKCSICDKAFRKKSHMNTHVLSHSTEKPHKCNQCEKAFRQKSHLNVHILSHNAEKPHKCNYCAKEFLRNYDLNKHILSHFGEKPYKCTECDKAYTEKSKLTKHMLLHSSSENSKTIQFDIP